MMALESTLKRGRKCPWGILKDSDRMVFKYFIPKNTAPMLRPVLFTFCLSHEIIFEATDSLACHYFRNNLNFDIKHLEKSRDLLKATGQSMQGQRPPKMIQKGFKNICLLFVVFLLS